VEKQGRAVEYRGQREFIIDGKKYMFYEMNLPMGRVPMQHTILKPLKG